MAVAWVTGASGFIGRHAALACARRGLEVAGLGRDAWVGSPGAWGLKSWVEGPIEAASLAALADLTGIPDTVIHLAGGSSVGSSLVLPLDDFNNSVGSTAILLEWLRLHAPAAVVVCASSAAVYGAGHTAPITVEAELRPASPYGFHKRAVELVCESYARNFRLRTRVVRLFSVFGPGLKKQLLWDLCTKLKTCPDEVWLGGTGAETRDWVEVGDAAAMLVAAAAGDDHHAIWNGGTGRGTAVQEVAALVLEAWSSRARLRFTGQRRPGDPEYLVAGARSPSIVGTSLSLPESLADYVAWFKQASP